MINCYYYFFIGWNSALHQCIGCTASWISNVCFEILTNLTLIKCFLRLRQNEFFVRGHGVVKKSKSNTIFFLRFSTAWCIFFFTAKQKCRTASEWEFLYRERSAFPSGCFFVSRLLLSCVLPALADNIKSAIVEHKNRFAFQNFTSLLKYRNSTPIWVWWRNGEERSIVSDCSNHEEKINFEDLLKMVAMATSYSLFRKCFIVLTPTPPALLQNKIWGSTSSPSLKEFYLSK